VSKLQLSRYRPFASYTEHPTSRCKMQLAFPGKSSGTDLELDFD